MSAFLLDLVNFEGGGGNNQGLSLPNKKGASGSNQETIAICPGISFPENYQNPGKRGHVLNTMINLSSLRQETKSTLA